MGNIIKLVFQTVAAGSGLAEIDAQTAKFQKRLGKMGQGAAILGRAFGNLGGVIGNSLGMLAQGGIWGAAANVAVSAIGKIADKWREHNRLLKDAALAARGLSREYFTAEFRAGQVQKRVEKWRKAAADAAKEAADAERAAKADAAERLASRKEANVKENEYHRILEKISAEKHKAALEDADELTRLKARVALVLEAAKANTDEARRGVRQAAETGGDTYMAKMRLDLAKAEQANAVRSAKKLVEEYKKAKQDAEDEAQARFDAMVAEDEAEAERQRKREMGERKMAEIRKQAAETVKRLEEQIAGKRAEADALEQNAARARGVSFGEWMRGERDLGREGRTAARKQANREKAVDDEIARIEKTSPRARSAWAKKRLAKLREWKADQDPANNPAAKEADDLEKKRDEILRQQDKKLGEIKALLEEVTKI